MRYITLVFTAMLFLLTGCTHRFSPIPPEDEPGARTERSGGGSSASIASTEITEFECDFFGKEYGMVYDHCHFTAKLEGDAVVCLAEGTTWSDEPYSVEFTADAAMLADLQTIVEEQELVKRNGYYGHTNGLPYGIGGSLSILYASGEKLTMSDNGGVPFPCALFCELFERYAEEAGRLFLLDGTLFIPNDWAETLSGWWVQMGEDEDPANPIVYRFTENNMVFSPPEAYEYYLKDESGYDFHDDWKLADGKPMYIASPDDPDFRREYRIALTDETHMQLIEREYGEVTHMVKSTAPEAIRFLQQGEYAELVE